MTRADWRRTIGLSALMIAALAFGAAPDVDAKIVKLRQRVAAAAEPKSSDDIMRYYQDRLALAEAIGLTRPAEQIQRVRYLLGNFEDNRALASASEEALTIVDDLIVRLDDQIERARVDETLVVLGLPRRLARARAAVVYKRAWVRFNLATTISKDFGDPADRRRVARRRRLLADAAEDVATLIEAGQADAVKDWATLLRGMALARIDADAPAEAALAKTADEKSSVAVRELAMFEQALHSIKCGRWSEAAERIKAFAALPAAKAGEAGAVRRELHAAMLAYEMHSRHAKAIGTDKPDLRKQLLQKADLALAESLARRDRFQSALCKQIAHRWDGTKGVGLPTAALFAKAVIADGDEAIDGYRAVLDRDYPAGRLLAPHSLWRLGSAYYKRSRSGSDGRADRLAAAGRFEQLARQYPDSPFAEDAASNAVRILAAWVDSLDRADRPVNESLREAYIGAIRTRLSLTRSADDRDGYLCQQGNQLHKLGRSDEAAKAYRQVGTQSWAYPVAQAGLLMQEVATGLRGNNHERLAAAKRLVETLQAVGKAAHERSGKVDNAARAKRIVRAGFEADSAVVELLRDVVDSKQAIAHCDLAIARWGGVTSIDRFKVLRIETFICRREMEAAVKDYEAMKALDPARAAEVIIPLALERRAVITHDGSNLAMFPEIPLLDTACRAAKETGDPRWYECRQLLAEACLRSRLRPDTIEIYRELAKLRPGDPVNIEGMARCHLQAGRYGQANKACQELLTTLDSSRFPQVWLQAQLTLARSAFHLAGDDQRQLGRIHARLMQIRAREGGFGHLEISFGYLLKTLRSRMKNDL